MAKESFPCIVCNQPLYREIDDYEAQPRDGVMCVTEGNYGSRVFDPLDGRTLHFNICDSCLVARQSAVYESRSVRPVWARGWGIVGWQRVTQRPYVPWKPDLPSDDDRLVIDVDEPLPEGVTLNVDLDDLRRQPGPLRPGWDGL